MKNNRNELIVEFLELRPCERCKDCGSFYTNAYGEYTPSNMLIFKVDDMRYHFDWIWLMPVIKKIESIWDDEHGYFMVHISGNSCTIQGTKFRSDKITEPAVYFNNIIFDTKEESTYQAVIMFIDWYLNNLKKDENED